MIACHLLYAGAGQLIAQAPTVLPLDKPNGLLTEPFSLVRSIVELTDGRVLVSDLRENLLVVGDFQDGSRSTVSRIGSGPSEYGLASTGGRRLGDTIYVFDPPNRRYLRIDGTGKPAGSVPFPTRAPITGAARDVDGRGNLHWTGDLVSIDPVSGPRRNLRTKVVRWTIGSDTTVPVIDVADHAAAMHGKQFYPFPQRDGWVVDARGRIGVVVASEYRLKWFEGGKLVFEGPPIPFTPIAIGGAEREAFRAEKAAMGSAGGARPGAGTDPATMVAARRRAEASYPDAIFPTAMSPFVDDGVRLSPGGDIWVERSRALTDSNPRFDVLTAEGKLRATVTLPSGRRMISLDRKGIYLVSSDADGLQTVERYAWPSSLR